MNKPGALAFLWIFVFFLLQNSLQFMFAGQSPPLLLIGVLFYGLSEGPLFGLIIGLVAGFFVDIFGVGKLGMPIILFGSLGVLSGYAKSKIFHDGLLTRILFPTVGTYLFSCSNFVITRFFFEEESSPPGVFLEAVSIPALILTAVISPFIFSFLHRFTYGKRP